jgi:hypothetical protein
MAGAETFVVVIPVTRVGPIMPALHLLGQQLEMVEIQFSEVSLQ